MFLMFHDILLASFMLMLFHVNVINLVRIFVCNPANVVTTFLQYLYCHLFHFESKDTVIATARRQMLSLVLDYIHALLLLLFWWPPCCLENNWQAIYEKCQFNVSPLLLAMQCMWLTQVSSGTIQQQQLIVVTSPTTIKVFRLVSVQLADLKL